MIMIPQNFNPCVAWVVESNWIRRVTAWTPDGLKEHEGTVLVFDKNQYRKVDRAMVHPTFREAIMASWRELMEA